MSDVTLKVEGLDKLLKALKGSMPKARVGVLGSKNARSSDKKVGTHSPTNAEVGAVHEFGAPARGIQQRSFLRVPIADNLQKYMEKSGAFDKDVLRDVLAQGTIKPWMTKMAVLAESIVSDAFDSSGFGKWPGWKTKNYTNNAGQILVDTQQLRNSVTSEVRE